MSYRVLVCGGRNYADSIHVCDVLGQYHAACPIFLLIQGGANGADFHAKNWAHSAKVECVTVPAEWDVYGHRAGPIRNQKMIDDYGPDVVIAFPGGHGTRDMLRRARSAGVPVIEIQPRAK